MLARSFTVGVDGVDGYVVTVEADVRLGLPGLTLVGRAAGAVVESRERVRSAVGHCGHELRPRRQIVNLAPADRRKDSPGLDLAVASALLAAHEVVPTDTLANTVLWGELGLDGRLQPAAGTLVVADCARRQGFTRLVVPRRSLAEATLVDGLTVLGVDSLAELAAHLRGEKPVAPASRGPRAPEPIEGPDLADIRGLTLGRLAVELFVAGGHNLLFHGPPGVGKTMLARRAGALAPDLDEQAALEVTKIHGVAFGRIPEGLIRRPPVRAPHHTVSPAGLLGGGTPVRPGEVSLAHRGVLFLDELPEYPRTCLEGLREPLEDGCVTLVRARYAVELPARFQLLAAMNPCPCGFLGHPQRQCTCPASAAHRYASRVSGPLLDRMDLLVPLAPIEGGALARAEPGESSADVRTRIGHARARQRARLHATRWSTNAEVPAAGGALAKACPLTDGAAKLLDALAFSRRLSPRAQHRLRRVAMTVADLRRPQADPLAPIDDEDLAVAAQLRSPPDAGVPA